MPDAPLVTQLPSTPSVSEPASGTYGKATADANLMSAMKPLPAGQGAVVPNVSSTPGAAKPGPMSGPFGLPGAITNPTQQPGTPVGTPLAVQSNPVASAGAPQAQRLALLDMLSRNPDVSEQSREWAKTVLAKLQ